MQNFIEVAIICFVAYWTIKIVYAFLYNKIMGPINEKRREKNGDDIIARERMRMNNTVEASNFFARKRDLEARGFSTKGVYIFTNKTNNRKYVGQSVNILNRVSTHLKGRGNEDVHFDMQLGQRFTIEFIKLEGSNSRSLNALEKHYITKHNSYRGGYNKTSGNS